MASAHEDGKKLTGDPRIDFGWFSRRHESRDARDAAQARREKRMRDKADLRVVNEYARAERTPEEQLAVLDQRLGVGIGAKRERARLKAVIAGRSQTKKACETIARYP